MSKSEVRRMTGCEISIRKYDTGKPVQVINVKGYIDAHTYPELEKVLNSLIAKGNYNLIVNLKRAEYMSTMGFGALFGMVGKVRQNQGDLRLVSPLKIRRIANLIGCSSVIEIFDSLKEALSSFKKLAK